MSEQYRNFEQDWTRVQALGIDRTREEELSEFAISEGWVLAAGVTEATGVVLTYGDARALIEQADGDMQLAHDRAIDWFREQGLLRDFYEADDRDWFRNLLFVL